MLQLELSDILQVLHLLLSVLRVEKLPHLRPLQLLKNLTFLFTVRPLNVPCSLTGGR
jgi:hypothetical protein